MATIDKLKFKVWHSDCVRFLKRIPRESLDSCVTDPPYGLNFMGKAWDSGAITFDKRVWRLLFRKLKAGAYVLAFGGTRTVHRLTCALEDAGFEIRDMLSWVYGSGFPKGLSVSKAIDKKFGLKQPVIGRQKTARPIAQGDYERIGKIPMATNEKDGSMSNPELQGVITQPISPEAQYWEGWNTVLKPAHEPIMLARKPISESSVVEHVLKHGIGALNIGECRVEVNPDVDVVGKTTTRGTREAETWRDGSGFKNEENAMAGVLPSGRYPANLILSHHPDCKLIQEGETSVKDVSTHASSTKLGRYGIYGDYDVPVNMRHSFVEGKPEIWACVEGCPVRTLNEQSGIRKSGKMKQHIKGGQFTVLGKQYPHYVETWGDSGGAARFFKTFEGESNPMTEVLPSGRYPANFILSHHPDCKLIKNGKTIITDRSAQANEPLMGKKDIYGHYHPEIRRLVEYTGEPEVWECVEGCPVRMLNEQSGKSKGSKSGIRKAGTELGQGSGWNKHENVDTFRLGHLDSGGAARFFYCPKPSVKERALGLESLGLEHNPHVTVKPIRLVRYLIRLITPFGGVVADPFLGSGTTAIAAEMEGFQWVGCDNNKEYCSIARARIEAARKQARAEP